MLMQFRRAAFGLVAALCLSCPALAQERPTPPVTVEMPSNVIAAVRQYLGARPHDEVSAVIAAIDACVSIQVPDKDGRIEDHGQCPPVSMALRDRKAKTAAPKTAEPVPGAPN